MQLLAGALSLWNRFPDEPYAVNEEWSVLGDSTIRHESECERRFGVLEEVVLVQARTPLFREGCPLGVFVTAIHQPAE